MEHAKLNNMAKLAHAGNETALEDLISYFIPIIQRESERIWLVVYDQTSFEYECYQLILKMVEAYEEGMIRSFKSAATKRIMQIRAKHLKQRKRTQVISVESLAGFDGIDVLANVETEVISNISVKEKISLLAEGDSKKRVVLNAWKDGNKSDRELSNYLAVTFGGTPEGNRAFIKRFKTDCRSTLENAV